MDDPNINPRQIRAAPATADHCLGWAELVDQVETALLSHSSFDSDAVLAKLGRVLSPDDITDNAIPELARRLGTKWCEDQLSFAEVTIGTSRLQTMLRDVERRSRRVLGAGFETPTVLLIVAEGNDHVLSAMVASHQFRRLGATVRLSLCEPIETVAATLRTQTFDLVAISACGSDSLDHLRSLVNMVRTGVAPCPRVVVGGSIVTTDLDAAQSLGADACLCDPREALNLCVKTKQAVESPVSKPLRQEAVASKVFAE